VSLGIEKLTGDAVLDLVDLSRSFDCDSPEAVLCIRAAEELMSLRLIRQYGNVSGFTVPLD